MAENTMKTRLSYFSSSMPTNGTVNVLVNCICGSLITIFLGIFISCLIYLEREDFTTMVSTSQTYLETLGKDLYVTHEVQNKKRSYELKVHSCKNLLDVLEYMPEEFFVDFIIFVIDPAFGNCLNEIDNNLVWIDNNFPREKICIVIPEASFLKTAVSPSEIWDYARQNQFNLINGQIKKTSGLFIISKRILNIMEACCGVLNGIPMLNVV